MTETVDHLIGIMDPNCFSFRATIEGLLNFWNPEIKYKSKIHRITHRRIKCRPYDVLNAKTTCDAIINRGAHWLPHFNSFFTIVAPHTYLLNDMVSFKAIDKNTGYGHMYKLGFNIPPTYAIPQEDYSEFYKSEKVHPDLIFCDFDFFDLHQIGEEVGYPAYLKPQDGGGWKGVEKVSNYEELMAAYKKSGEKPLNLQKAIDYTEFVRSVGIGPQIMPMHYNAKAEHSHDRYLRSATQAVAHNFLTFEQADEIKKICKIINAFYGWDHNSCESLISVEDGKIYLIDFANAYPDSTLTSLHYYFPDLVKAMIKWLIFCCVNERKRPINFGYNWPEYFKVAEIAKKENWTYKQKVDKYAELADKHFDTERFEEFCHDSFKDFDEIALQFFMSDEFEHILVEKIKRYFKISHEVPEKIDHYMGIHLFWLKCEKDRLGF